MYTGSDGLVKRIRETHGVRGFRTRAAGEQQGKMKLDLTPEEFILRAIETLRQPPYKGIHCVYSGFNEAFRKYFPNLDPVETTNELAEQGKIVVRSARGGVILYKPGEGPSAQAQDALRRILTYEQGHNKE